MNLWQRCLRRVFGRFESGGQISAASPSAPPGTSCFAPKNEAGGKAHRVKTRKTHRTLGGWYFECIDCGQQSYSAAALAEDTCYTRTQET